MALTNAERQARFRKKQTSSGHKGGMDRDRLSCYVSSVARWRLKNLTAYHGITQGEVVDLAIEALENALLATFDGGRLQNAYFERKLRKDGTVVK